MSEKNLSIDEMKKLQTELYEVNKDMWEPRSPEYAKNFILYMVEEIGECISIIKKKGINAVMDDKNVRERFLEEMTDVQNYYIEVLNSLNITAEDFSDAYIKKHNSNMKRDYKKDNSIKYQAKTF